MPHAVKIYLERLKRDKKLEKLMQIKTNYKNHLKDFFGDLKIKEIDKDVIAKYKQKEFDNGCQLKSVQFLKYFLYGNRLVMTKSGSTMRKLKIEQNVCNFQKNKFDKIKPNGDDFVFTIDNAPFTQLYFDENVLIPLSKELGIEKLNPSDLQHNFVNMCIKQNVPLTYIQKSIGTYGIVNFVRVYKKLIEQMEDRVYNPINNLKI